MHGKNMTFGGLGNGLEGTQGLLVNTRDRLTYPVCARGEEKTNTCCYGELNSARVGSKESASSAIQTVSPFLAIHHSSTEKG